jgi:hypothetical protein
MSRETRDEKIDRKKMGSFENLPIINTIEQEAPINLFESKGIIKRQELRDEIRRIKKKTSDDKSIPLFWMAFFFSHSHGP